MANKFTYDGNEQETYTIFENGEFFAHVDANEDNVIFIVGALNVWENEHN